MNGDGYLSRIGVDRSDVESDRASLFTLQKAHLMAVPFENLDIHWKRPIELDIAKFYAKIVDEKRGGFCYELNGLFNGLLRVLGFKTRLVSARVFNGTDHGPEYDHAAIIVTIGDEEYLADVGFGEFAAEPLRLEMGREQVDAAGTFILRRLEDNYLEVAKRDGDAWASQYTFKDIARDLAEFAEMCDFQQYSRDSHFTKGKVCSLMTEGGRKTLTDKKFIITTRDEKEERAIGSENEFDAILMQEFNIRAISKSEPPAVAGG
ncbi:MAG TPA: arylamine N-acetyltransferase [Pyrinomonadaceae bacterium]|nr:arylamine N-acetyltransferase [Pyrinomonadaceae bacterium]